MTPQLILIVIAAYFIFLMLIAQFTKGKSDNTAFFTGNKNSPWFLVAFGMIGASLSGVTFISIPGGVGSGAFAYMQIVLGYLVGYFIIATVLIPTYYKLNLISIYSYFTQRFGSVSRVTASLFFLISKIVGASFRIFLVAGVMQYFVFDYYEIPFIITTAFTILFIWIYTFQGGIKTIVFTDTLQTFFMLASLVICIVVLGNKLGGIDDVWSKITEAGYTKTFFFEDFANNKLHFWKQFLGGALIALVMTGLDQDMMQKNLTCKSIEDAQKNVFTMTLSLLPVNLLFLILGGIIYVYAQSFQIAMPARADYLFPEIAFNHLPLWGGIVFLLGLTAAAYSSADSALAALTTAFCVDFLGMDKNQTTNDNSTRIKVHIAFSVLLIFVVWAFDKLGDDSVINQIFTLAGYTYGPLLGMFSFGLLTKVKVKDELVPIVCVFSPIATYIIGKYAPIYLGYTFGFELLLMNGIITFVGLFITSFFVKAER
jgi:Na+/proline symporter